MILLVDVDCISDLGTVKELFGILLRIVSRSLVTIIEDHQFQSIPCSVAEHNSPK